jgi:hypothetical protein
MIDTTLCLSRKSKKLAKQSPEIISGGRRQKIALKRGDVSVPVYWHTCTDREAEELAAFENVKRADLNPIDETNMVINMIKLRLDLPNRQAAIDLLHTIIWQSSGKKNNFLQDNVVLSEIIALATETIRQFTKGQLPPKLKTQNKDLIYSDFFRSTPIFSDQTTKLMA